MKSFWLILILFSLFSCVNTQTELINVNAEETQEDAEESIKDSYDDYESDDLEIETEEPIE